MTQAVNPVYQVRLALKFLAGQREAEAALERPQPADRSAPS